MPHLPVPTTGGTHHSLWSYLLLAVHAALPESERQELVQVSHLLRGCPRCRPQKVKPKSRWWQPGEEKMLMSVFSAVLLQWRPGSMLLVM